MTRSLIVDPANVRAKSAIKAPEVPVNAYKPDFKAELKRYGKQGLIDILHDMIAVRSFETMLNSIKTTGAWNGVEYNHRGPAHLSIGQESAVVGQASQLRVEDFVFGSHRSHGEILAKCFSASRNSMPPTWSASCGVPGRRDPLLRRAGLQRRPGRRRRKLHSSTAR